MAGKFCNSQGRPVKKFRIRQAVLTHRLPVLQIVRMNITAPDSTPSSNQQTRDTNQQNDFFHGRKIIGENDCSKAGFASSAAAPLPRNLL
jgi:hypothetical protein